MIDRIPISHIPSYKTGEEVPVAGWVDSIRRSGKHLTFMDVRDNTGSVQTISFGPERGNETHIQEALHSITPESTVAMQGIVSHNDRIRSRNSFRLPGVELQTTSLDVLSLAEPLPITRESNFTLRLAHRALDLRLSPEKAFIFTLGTSLEQSMIDRWEELGYVGMHSAKIVGLPTEGGSDVFKLDYFGRTASLTQSPQFAKQRAISSGFPGVYEIGAVYRAENSNTTRHVTEFTGADVEIPWIDSHHDVMDIEEDLLRCSFGHVIEKHGKDIESMFGIELTLPDGQFPRITLREARAMVESEGYKIPPTTEDLDPEAERRICDIVRRKFGSEFVFITDFPAELRPFYHMRKEDDAGLTKSFDLLWRGIEITTGAQREHRLSILKDQIIEKGFGLDQFEDYLGNFRYGCPPHGGFGLGLNRILAKMTGQKNVAEATFQPNTPNHLTA